MAIPKMQGLCRTGITTGQVVLVNQLDSSVAMHIAESESTRHSPQALHLPAPGLQIAWCRGTREWTGRDSRNVWRRHKAPALTGWKLLPEQ